MHEHERAVEPSVGRLWLKVLPSPKPSRPVRMTYTFEKKDSTAMTNSSSLLVLASAFATLSLSSKHGDQSDYQTTPTSPPECALSNQLTTEGEMGAHR
jgi:hypothetical protein